MADDRHLAFLKSQFLTVAVQEIIVPHHPKFRGDQTLAVRHLAFVVRVFGLSAKSIWWWSLSLCKIWIGSMQ